jgi:xanthine dehydrogenase accessory factor
MDNEKIFKKAFQLLKNVENIALVTVISTTGSTPGKVGYKMLLWGKKPEIFGTVGGGGSEAEIIKAAKTQLDRIENQVINFTLGETLDDEKGICGGKIEFLIETFDKRNLPFFEELTSFLDSGQKAALISIICPEKPPEKIPLYDISESNSLTSINLPADNIESIKKILKKEEAAKLKIDDNIQLFVETISEQPVVFVFGAGHLSFYISKLAKSVGFNVIVCDDRKEFASKERFPDADSIVVERFENVFEQLSIGENSYIVIVTKGHKWDEVVLENSLKTDAKYIGMIGSKRKTLTIFKRLYDKGFTERSLNEVFSPIGISIGALTPQEIALSIVCELVKVRRTPDTDKIKHMKIPFSKE